MLLLLGCAVLAALPAAQLSPRLLRKPLLEPEFGRHPSRPDRRTLAGSALFGAGWGLSSACPGSAIAGHGVGNWPLPLSLAGLPAGAYAQGHWFRGR